MTPKRVGETSGAEKAKQDGDGKKPKPDEPATTRAQDEAFSLIAQMEREVAALTTFLAEEKRSAKRKAPSPKRIARLRLVSDDIASAAKLSAKSVKN